MERCECLQAGLGFSAPPHCVNDLSVGSNHPWAVTGQSVGALGLGSQQKSLVNISGKVHFDCFRQSLVA